MKKQIVMLLMGIGMISTAMAQEPENKKEKMEAAKIAFITKELELTTEEAQKFWPVYNQREAESDAVRKEMRAKMKGKKIEEMSDAEVEKSMDEMLALKQKELDIEKKYNTEFKKVLPVKKVAKLHMAERKFKEEVMKEWKDRHPGGPEGKGPGGNGRGGKDPDPKP
ncbi:MAG: hypothetical protein K1X56_05895 [Flavobacteriales bacterium]|nr:hypothetical protein [Flavobacteriales bacterium]